MGKQKTVSVFKRLFLMALGLLMVVYVVLTGFFVTFVAQQRKVETSGQQSRVSNSASVMELQLQAIFDAEYQLLNDSHVAQLAMGLYEDDYERSQMILEILTTLHNTQSIHSIIEDIVIMIPAEQIELSARNGYHLRKYDREYFDVFSTFESESLIRNGENLEMYLTFPLRTSTDETYIPDFMIRIIFSAEYMDKFIEQFRHEDLEGAFWVLSEKDGETILFSESENEKALMQHWIDVWNKEKRPAFLMKETSCEHGEFYFTSQNIASYGLTLVTYQNSLAVAWRLGKSLWVITAVILAVGILFGVLIYWANNAVNKPIRKIMEAFEKVRAGKLDVRIFHKKNDEFGYIYDSLNATVSDIEHLIENIKEQKVLLENAELMQLQSQINPHFLYNSFYNIKFMAHNEDYEQIETFVTALAKYYRFINKETNLNVALSSEVEHMENYIDIQQMRFGDKITVLKESVPEEVRNFKVPKLILQPIIENAYNYGLKDKLAEGVMYIRYRMDAQYLYIEIEDNGGDMTKEKLAQLNAQIHTYEGDCINHALTNIQRRLMLAYGDACGLQLEIGDCAGLRVTLKMDMTVQL